MGLELLDDLLASILAAQANEDAGGGVGGVVVPAVVGGDAGVRGHDVDGFEVVAPAQLPVVGVVGRGDLEEARGVLGLGVALGPAVADGLDDIVVFDDGDDAADEGELDLEASDGVGPRVGGVDRDAGVAQVGLGAGGGDGDPGVVVLWVLVGAGVALGFEFAPGHRVVVPGLGLVHEGIAEVVERAVDLFVLDLVVGEGGLGDGVPVDEALASVDQAVFEEAVEGLADRPRADFVHGEALAVPVAGAAHLLELVDDAGLELVLPALHLLDELVASGLAGGLHLLVVGERRLAGFLELAVDDGLGGDAGVVGAGHPEGLEALHAVGAGQHILQRVVEGVPEVEGGGDIGRGDEDAVGGLLAGEDAGGVGAEGARLDPALPDAGLVLGGGVGLGQFSCGHGGTVPGRRGARPGILPPHPPVHRGGPGGG